MEDRPHPGPLPRGEGETRAALREGDRWFKHIHVPMCNRAAIHLIVTVVSAVGAPGRGLSDRS